MKLIDLSHTIEDGLITYKGLPAPIICDFWTREESRDSYEGGTEFQIGKIEMVSNTGTYIDCPFHRYVDGKDLNDMALEKFAHLESLMIRYDYEKYGLAMGPEHFEGLDLNNKAILINTSWSRKWNTDSYFENHPFLSETSAQLLADHAVSLVGIDSYNIDDSRTRTRPVHSILLRDEIPIVEHLTNLSALPAAGFTFSAVPPKIKGMGSFPVRAFAKIS